MRIQKQQADTFITLLTTLSKFLQEIQSFVYKVSKSCMQDSCKNSELVCKMVLFEQFQQDVNRVQGWMQNNLLQLNVAKSALIPQVGFVCFTGSFK